MCFDCRYKEYFLVSRRLSEGCTDGSSFMSTVQINKTVFVEKQCVYAFLFLKSVFQRGDVMPPCECG